jgi:hypothetical protein
MATWNDAFNNAPADGDSPSQGDDKIRETRVEIWYRGRKEHGWGGSSTADGWHKEGSGRAYYTTSVNVRGAACTIMTETNPTQDVAFGYFDSYIPTASDTIGISGGYSYSSSLATYAYAQRISETEIILKGIYYNDGASSIVSTSIEDGNASPLTGIWRVSW